MKNMKKGLALLLALCMMLGTMLLAACQNGGGESDVTTTAPADTDPVCDDHIDTDGDNLCDLCDATIAEPVSVTVTLKTEDGAPIKDAEITWKQSNTTLATGNTDAAGKYVASLLPGTYTIYIDGLAEGWLCSATGAKRTVSAEESSFDLVAVDNNPDGTAEKPYFVGNDPVTLTFPAGATYVYFAKGSSKYLTINNANAKVTYKGSEYLPEEGVIRLLIDEAESTNAEGLFSVTNTASTANEIVVFFESLPGSLENPYKITDIAAAVTAEVGKGVTVYYQWTATATGTLKLFSDTADNKIMMQNKDTNKATTYTNDSTMTEVSIDVNVGDKILIAVASVNDADVINTVIFTLTETAAE